MPRNRPYGDLRMECSRQRGQEGKALRQAGAGIFVEKQEGQCDWSRACVREIVGDEGRVAAQSLLLLTKSFHFILSMWESTEKL